MLLLGQSLNVTDLGLDLLAFSSQLITENISGKISVRDPVRKISVLLTPEESVRQLLILYLMDNFPHIKNYISVEKELKINLRKKRFDLLVYDRQMQPFLLVECKAPAVKISQAVFDQVSWYNVALRAPYLLVTNGLNSYCAKIHFEEKSYNFTDNLPLQFG